MMMKKGREKREAERKKFAANCALSEFFSPFFAFNYATRFFLLALVKRKMSCSYFYSSVSLMFGVALVLAI